MVLEISSLNIHVKAESCFYLQPISAISVFSTKQCKKNKIVTASLFFLFGLHFLWLNSATAAPKARMELDLSTVRLGCTHECPSKGTLPPIANDACGSQTKIGAYIHISNTAWHQVAPHNAPGRVEKIFPPPPFFGLALLFAKSHFRKKRK